MELKIKDNYRLCMITGKDGRGVKCLFHQWIQTVGGDVMAIVEDIDGITDLVSIHNLRFLDDKLHKMRRRIVEEEDDY